MASRSLTHSLPLTQTVSPLKDAWKRFTTDELKLSTFYVTNTHPTSKVLKLLSPFKVLSIAPLVESILLEEEPYSPESPIAANM